MVFDHFPVFALKLGLEKCPEIDHKFCFEKIRFFWFFFRVFLCFYEVIFAWENSPEKIMVKNSNSTEN